MKVWCVFKYGYDNPDLFFIYSEKEPAEEMAKIQNEHFDTEDFYAAEWEVS